MRLSTSGENTALIQQAWDSKLRRAAHTADILTGVTGNYNDKAQTVPSAAVVEVKAPKGVRKHTVPLLMDLSNAGQTGRTGLVGNEEEQAVKHLTIEANEVKHGVITEQYGVDAVDKSAYGLLEVVNPQLGLWAKETMGKHARQALCETYSINLTAAPTSATQGINKNIFFAGVASASQPAYDSTLADYVTAIDTASPNTAGASNQLTLTVLNKLETWAAVTKEIKPLVIGGRSKYVLLVPSRQRMNLMDVSVSNGIADYTKYNGTEQARVWQGYMGEYGSFILVEDTRAPTCTVNTTVTFGYKGAGTTDGRAAAGENVFDVGMILGEGALWKLISEDWHYEEEVQEYKRDVGLGIFSTYGYTAGEFDLDTKTDSSRYNKSSALVMLSSKGL